MGRASTAFRMEGNHTHTFQEILCSHFKLRSKQSSGFWQIHRCNVLGKKEKRMGLIPISLPHFAKKKTDSVPSVCGTWLLFVLSKTMMSKSMFCSHNISQVSLQRKSHSFGCGYLLQQWIWEGDGIHNGLAVMIAPGLGRWPCHKKRVSAPLHWWTTG